jgi:hypothetical protein
MTIYVVRKKGSAESDPDVHRYVSNAPIEWLYMEFDTHDHIALAPKPLPPLDPENPLPDITRREFRNRFTTEERIAIDRLRRNLETMPIPEDIRDRIRTGFADYDAADPIISLSDPRVPMLMGIFVSFGCMHYERIEEVLYHGN